MKKFAAQILGMTNQCNLRCTYCNWTKDKFHNIAKQDILNAKDNIKSLRKFLDSEFPSIQLIEYSGGEVTLFPEILDIMLTTFYDKWLRIVTNGTLINEEFIIKVKGHGKIFVGLSLDGSSIESNKTRFGDNLWQFNRILTNLNRLLENHIPVMLLCTLNSVNISKFYEYVRYIEKEYSKYIESGFLFMPAHYVFNYSSDNGMPTKEQELKLVGYLDTTNDLVVNTLHEHYTNLSYFIENRKHLHPCHIPEWCLPIHFRGNSIIEDGMFTSFGCGMRGIMNLGEFSIYNLAKFSSIVNDKNLLENVKFMNNENCESHCFVDWYTVDLILQGVIPITTAQRLFVFFRDPSISEYIKQNKIDNNIKYFSYKTCGTCSTSIEIGINKRTDTIDSVKFIGGCQANLKVISSFVTGMNISDVINRLKGINCQCKGTSCPDQLSQALENYKNYKI